MIEPIRERPELVGPGQEVLPHRPLIGVPMGRERSQRFFGLPMYIMNQTYVREIERRGALPVLIPLNMSDATLEGTFSRLDGLFLPGGEDMDPATYGEDRHELLGPVDKERDRTELLLTRLALAAGMPVFGVCRGVQVINVACGGALYQDLHDQRPDLEKHDYYPPKFQRFRISHEIQIEADSRLAQALGMVHEINSMHHQGIKRLGATLRVVAKSPDGLVEAVECPALPFVLGVQWHPEELAKTDQHSSDLFGQFVWAAAQNWRDDVPEGWSNRFAEIMTRHTVSEKPEAIGEPLATSADTAGFAQL